MIDERLKFAGRRDGLYKPAVFFAVFVLRCFAVFAATEMRGAQRLGRESHQACALHASVRKLAAELLRWACAVFMEEIR